MSRGLGKVQRDVLEAVRQNGGPILSLHLISDVWQASHAAGDTIPLSAYETIRRAATTLVKRGLLRSGAPCGGKISTRRNARAVYWLPEDTPPPLVRHVPGKLVEYGILKLLESGPMPYSDVVINVENYLGRGMDMPVSRAVRRLVAAGKITRERGAGEFFWAREVVKRCDVATFDKAL